MPLAVLGAGVFGLSRSVHCIVPELAEIYGMDRKGREGLPHWRLEVGCAVLPKQAEMLQGRVGHDVTRVDAEGHVVVVADGVGGWVKHGVDPRQAADACVSGLLQRVKADPAKSLDGALADVLANEKFAGKGTTTVAAARLCPVTHQLECLSVGDGVLLVFRRSPRSDGAEWRLVASVDDPESRRSFNRPQQVGDQAPTCTPALARVDVRLGDMVVVASDGVADNLGTDGILHALNAPVARFAGTAEKTAQYLAGLAFLRSIMCVPESPPPFGPGTAVGDSGMPCNTPTPYEIHRRLSGRKENHGGCGKRDDVSVAVGFVTEK